MSKVKFCAIVFILFCFFVACSSSNSMKISEQKMVKIIYDLHMADAIVNIENIKSPIRITLDSAQYDEILRAHGVTKQQLSWSIVYYSNLKKMEGIYTKVINELNLQVAASKGDEIYDSVPQNLIRGY